MRRALIALGLLLVLFGGALAHSVALSRLTQDLSLTLEQAQRQASDLDWAAAGRSIHEAEEAWSRQTRYLYILLRHSDIDQITTGLQEVEQYIRFQDYTACSAANTRLSARLKLLAEAERLSVSNVL